MIVVQFTDKTFKSITHDALEFIDDEGKLHRVDFRICRKNWVEWVNVHDPRPTIIIEDETNCVGEGNSMGSPMYIELFSEPRVRFEIRKRLFRPRPRYPQYFNLKRRFEQVGWCTLDLS
jgi:hypothetical protein